MEPTKLIDGIAAHLGRFRTTFAQTVKCKAISKALVLARHLDKALGLPSPSFGDMNRTKFLILCLESAKTETCINSRNVDVKWATKTLDSISFQISH